MLHESLTASESPTKTVFDLQTIRIARRGGIRAFIAVLTESCYTKIMETHRDWFHRSEWAYVRDLNVEKRRKEFVLGRCAGKLAASAYHVESNLSRLIIEPGVFGQPILKFHSDDNPELSITHTDNVALAVASQQGCPVGIDIEKQTDRDVSFLEGQITQNDLALLTGLTPNKPHACLRAWTIKEALSKILRVGITMPFALLELASAIPFDKNGLCCEYKNFPQYRCYSWPLDQYLIAVTTPRTMRLEVDIANLRDRLSQKISTTKCFA